MSFSIGDSVRSKVSPIVGFVADVRGGPNGPLYIVVAPDQPIGRSESLTAAELEEGPPPPEYSIGQTVTLHAGPGEVTARNGDTYVVTVKRKRRNFTFAHRYHLPAWRIAIGGGT